jgi:isopentenyl diphosphate isomerase/L-lactate dehydrogenase-like FMN-dependent dehydrogenase
MTGIDWNATRAARVVSTSEMRKRARRLPRAIFDAVDGGAGDEVTLRENRRAYERIAFAPPALADAGSRDLTTTILGDPVSMPLLLAPCGMARMLNSAGELAVARAAGKAGTIFAVSGVSSYPLEDIAGVATGPLWYQLYLLSDREATTAKLARARTAGYRVLCVTVDATIAALRERDVRNGLEIPPALSLRLVVGALRKPSWLAAFVRGEVGDAGLGARVAVRDFVTTIRQLIGVTSDELRWIRERWEGPLVVKGVMRGDDCEELLRLGVDGIVVSNHGGRQLDGARATIEILPEVVEAVNGRVEVFVDGGVWRGSDVVKAVALGARAVLIGKAYMFGLAAYGEAGVDRVLEIFRVELDRTLGMLGCSCVADLNPSLLAKSSLG